MSLALPLRRVGAFTSRATTSPTSSTTTTTYICSQCRHATLLRRPKRPYTFTQLITLSDGSSFLHRTTSPEPVYRSTRDSRNSLLWNPTSRKLLNVEEDEAGRLASFRSRFGRGYDAAAADTTAGGEEEKAAAAAPKTQAEKDAAAAAQAAEDAAVQEEEDNLLDLISSFGQEEQQQATQRSSGGGKKKR
jgi:predicted secreted protein